MGWLSISKEKKKLLDEAAGNGVPVQRADLLLD